MKTMKPEHKRLMSHGTTIKPEPGKRLLTSDMRTMLNTALSIEMGKVYKRCLRSVMDAYGVSEAVIQGPRGSRNAQIARATLAKMLRKHSWTFQAIADVMGTKPGGSKRRTASNIYTMIVKRGVPNLRSQ